MFLAQLHKGFVKHVFKANTSDRISLTFFFPLSSKVNSLIKKLYDIYKGNRALTIYYKLNQTNVSFIKTTIVDGML